MALASASLAALFALMSASTLAAPPWLTNRFGPSPRASDLVSDLVSDLGSDLGSDLVSDLVSDLGSEGPAAPEGSDPSDPSGLGSDGLGSDDLGADEADMRATAKQAFDEGLAAVASKEFEVAVASFERAYGLRPHPVTLFNLALALEKAERLPEAWELFDDVIDIVESNAERREVRRHMRTIEAEIAIVEIDANPSQRLCIDGLDMPTGETADYRLAVSPGRHELLLDTHSFAVEFEAGDRRVLLLDSAEDLVSGQRESRLMPAMIGASIGTGALALGLGIGAAAARNDRTQTGLAAGAATSAGLAVAAGVVAMLLETRAIPDPSAAASVGGDTCPGSPELEQRLDLRIGPTIGRPAEFAAAPITPRAPMAVMPIPSTMDFPHPHQLQPPRRGL